MTLTAILSNRVGKLLQWLISLKKTLYLQRSNNGSNGIFKLAKGLLQHGTHFLLTYAILNDDGSEKTILLQASTRQLGFVGDQENLSLRTVKNDS